MTQWHNASKTTTYDLVNWFIFSVKIILYRNNDSNSKPWPENIIQTVRIYIVERRMEDCSLPCTHREFDGKVPNLCCSETPRGWIFHRSTSQFWQKSVSLLSQQNQLEPNLCQKIGTPWHERCYSEQRGELKFNKGTFLKTLENFQRISLWIENSTAIIHCKI